MKKVINFTILAIACMAVACHKDAVLTRLQPVGFTSKLTASTDETILTSATDSTDVITFNWPAVVYPVKAHVTYTLQADLPADTLGTGAWANATSITIGDDILTRTFKGAEFNQLALNLGITASDTAKLVFRVEAYQDRPTYSNSISVTVSPWKAAPAFSHGWPVLYMPGAYEGWTFDPVPTAAAEQADIYEGYIYEPASQTDFGFKFTSETDWNGINYGSGATAGTLSTDGNAGNLELPGPGYYEVVANTSALTWSYTAVTWSIIGDATPGGWTSDTQMTYDETKGVWTVTANMVTSGSFKFRANNDWKIDFGIDADGHLGYADNTAYTYNGSINNITVPSNGNYTITLDLRNPNDYTYTLHKN